MARSYALCPIAPAPRIRNKLTTLFALLLSRRLFALVLSSLFTLHRSNTMIDFFIRRTYIPSRFNSGKSITYDSVDKTAFNEIHAISDNGTKEEPGEAAGAPAMEYLGEISLALVMLALLLSIFPVFQSSLIEEPTITSLRLP